MDLIIKNFQHEVIQKIRQKSTAKVSLDTFLFKSFKFFDLSNNGCVKKSDFFKAIAKCGVVVQPQNIENIYQYYAEQDGSIQYQNFIQEILFRKTQTESNSNSRLKFSNDDGTIEPVQNKSLVHSKRQNLEQSKFKNEDKKQQEIIKLQKYSDVLNYVRNHLRKQGLGSILSLAVQLKLTDTKKSHFVSKKTLNSLLGFLAKEHIEIIFTELSENSTQIDYSTFVYDLKGEIQPSIAKQIDNTFNFLDNRREGQFPIDYLLNKFISKRFFDKFKIAVQLYQKFQGIDDGVFTQDDFNDFMGFLAVDFDSGAQFKTNLIRSFYQQDDRSVNSHKSNRSRDFQLKQNKDQNQLDFRKNKEHQIQQKQQEDLSHSFHESHESEQKKSVSRYSQFEGKQTSSNKFEVFQSVITRIKKRLASKGTKGFLILEKALKNADTDQDTLLSAEKFNNVIRQQRIDITTTQSHNIFDLFDNEGTGSICFPEFMYSLRGNMPQNRRYISQKLWNQIKMNDETTTFAKIKHSLNFRNHPDIQNGRKYEEDIWKQIQQTILAIQQLNGVKRSDVITKNQFEEYLQNLSLSIIDDKLFQSVLFNFWKLDTSQNILNKYAGSRKLFDQSKSGYLMDHHRNFVQGGSVSQNAPFGTFHQPTNYHTQHRKL